MAILNYDNIYTQKGAPTANVNPKIIGAVWFDYETGVTYTCKDNTMNKNVWVRCCRTEDELLAFIKENTKKPSIDNSFGDFTEEETIVPEYDFDLNVENDFDWVCPPHIYPMFRYGKYLIIPLLSNNSNRGRSVSSDIYISSTGYLGYIGALESMVIPGTTLKYVPHKIRSSGYSDWAYAYPNGSWYTMLPKVNAIDDLISRITRKHRHFDSFYKSGQMLTLKAQTIDNITKDVRYNINFNILDQYMHQNTFQSSFIHIFPYTSTGSVISRMLQFKIHYNGETINVAWDAYTTDSVIRTGGWCTYFAIKIFA